jgi:hypothetical protein
MMTSSSVTHRSWAKPEWILILGKLQETSLEKVTNSRLGYGRQEAEKVGVQEENEHMKSHII